MNHTETIKKKLLHTLYDQASWLKDTSWACKKGCATCCTQSVNITSLEGQEILRYLKKQNNGLLATNIQKGVQKRDQNLISTNTFAANCLNKMETDETSGDNDWNFTPCIFLDDSYCGIYPVRPFDCRCFLSTVPCNENKTAEVEPLIITLNIVFHQINEHIDSNGLWGNMFEILHYLQQSFLEKDKPAVLVRTNNIHPCKAMPGFLIPPHEKSQVMRLVNRLFMTKIGEYTFVELLKKAQHDCKAPCP